MAFFHRRPRKKRRRADDDFFDAMAPARERKLALFASLSVMITLVIAIVAIGQISPDIDRNPTASIIRDPAPVKATAPQDLESTLPKAPR